MTRSTDVPSETRARRVLEQYLSECEANGKRPSVLGLASRLGLTNTTFRRHFPDLAREISDTRTQQPTSAGTDKQPNPYDILVARNAKLRRTNRILTTNIQLAVTQIKHLGVDNARLREALETKNNVTHIDRPDRPPRH